MFIVDFRDLSSKSDVAKTLGCTPDTLAPIPRSFLAQHRIPKRSSGFREAWEVTSATHQETLKTLATRLEDFASRALSGFPRASVHGFARGKSIVTNARVHAGARHLLRADIKDFFPTISRHRVARTFVDMGMTHDGVVSCGLHYSRRTPSSWILHQPVDRKYRLSRDGRRVRAACLHPLRELHAICRRSSILIRMRSLTCTARHLEYFLR